MEDPKNDGKITLKKVDQETKMGKKVIPFDKSKRSVKELVKDLQADMEEIEELLVIGKYKDGDWLFEYSDLDNELEWIGILQVFIQENLIGGYDEDE